MLCIVITITEYNHRSSYQCSLLHISYCQRTRSINHGWTSKHSSNNSSKHDFKYRFRHISTSNLEHTRHTYNLSVHLKEENKNHTHPWITECISANISVWNSGCTSKHTSHLISEWTSMFVYLNMPTNWLHEVKVHSKDYYHLTVKTISSPHCSPTTNLRVISHHWMNERWFDVHCVHQSHAQAKVHLIQWEVHSQAVSAGTIRCTWSMLYSHMWSQDAFHTAFGQLYWLPICRDDLWQQVGKVHCHLQALSCSSWFYGPGLSSVSNGSSFGPGRFYRFAWQQPYPIQIRRFCKRTIALRPQLLIGEFCVWYVTYATWRGASFGDLRFSISLNLSKR